MLAGAILLLCATGFASAWLHHAKRNVTLAEPVAHSDMMLLVGGELTSSNHEPITNLLRRGEKRE